MDSVHNLFKRVKRIEIHTRKLVDQLVGGDYSSIFRGQGVEFAELRPYTEGDDVKNIDWKVYARTKEPFVKVFREERELQVILLVDISGSLNFGSVNLTKAERAAEVAAVMALSAARSNDRVGMITFSDEVHDYVPPEKGRTHALGLVRRILELPDTHAPADIDGALRFAGRVLNRSALIFLMSDFHFPKSKLLRPMVMKYDVVGIHVFDPRELHVPPVGWVRFLNPESGIEQVVNTSSKRWRRKFAERVKEERINREELCRKNRLDIVSISTADDIVLPLRRFFEMRKRRKKR